MSRMNCIGRIMKGNVLNSIHKATCRARRQAVDKNDCLPIDRNLKDNLLLQLKQEIVAKILCNVRLYCPAPERCGGAHLDTAPDRGRSPSAACRPAEADCRKSVILYLTMRCEPGRFAVRRGQCRDAPPCLR